MINDAHWGRISKGRKTLIALGSYIWTPRSELLEIIAGRPAVAVRAEFAMCGAKQHDTGYLRR